MFTSCAAKKWIDFLCYPVCCRKKMDKPEVKSCLFFHLPAKNSFPLNEGHLRVATNARKKQETFTAAAPKGGSKEMFS